MTKTVNHSDSLLKNILANNFVFFQILMSSCVDFITAFVIQRFELRVLSCEVQVSPTMIESIDDAQVVAFETHYRGLTRVLDGFHLIEHNMVSFLVRLV